MADFATGRCARCAALATLGLEPGASDKQIRSTYHLLVKVWHPDRFQTDRTTRTQAEEKLIAINEAYGVLRKKPSFQQQQQGSSPKWHRTAAPQSHARRKRAPAAAPLAVLWQIVSPRLATLAFTVVAAVVVFWLLFRPLDAFLASNPATSYYYSAPRAEAAIALQQLRGDTWDRAAEHLHDLFAGASAPSAASIPAAENSADAQQRASKLRHSSASSPQVIHLVPLITAGMTKDEVVAVQGQPSAASGDKLMYGQSELDFNQGKLTSWHIDPASPLRVKLWPNAPVDPNLQYFTLGSSKNEVLAVQGTPTLFTQNVFGYGSSLVYFRNNRVTDWKSDPTSVQLRTR